MKTIRILTIIGLQAITFYSFGQSNPPLNTLKDSLYYSYGVQLAEMIKTRLPEWDADIIANALKAALDGNAMLTMAQCQEVAQAYAKVAVEEAKAEGIAYMEAYAKKENVRTTSTGLMYKMLTEGTGTMPVDTSQVTVHYTGRLMDGTIFDSSVKRGKPMTFSVRGVISGWTEGLQLMKVGGKAELVVPSELGYGARATGKIPAHSVLIFEIELLSVQ